MRLRWLGPVVILASLMVALSPPRSGTKAEPSPAASRATPAVPARPAAKAASQPTSKLAPPSVPHPTALFLSNWSQEGKRNVSFKATAMGTRFFLEDASGVTVYRFDGSGYVSDMFLPGATLAIARKRFHLK